MPRKNTKGNDPLSTFDGDLETSRIRFRSVTDTALKHAEAKVLNHASYGMAAFLFVRYGIDDGWLTKELDEEKRRIKRRAGFSIVNRDTA